MTRSQWSDIAKALGKVRVEIASSWPPKGGYLLTAADTHDRKLIYFATLDGFDKATRVLCRVLGAMSSRFDSARFMRLIGTQ